MSLLEPPYSIPGGQTTRPSNTLGGSVGSTIRVRSGSAIESEVFTAGSAGWQIKANGDVEFNTGTFRGSLEAGSIDIPDTTSANSLHVDSSGNLWIGATTFGAAKFSISNAGVGKIAEAFTVGSDLFFEPAGKLGTSAFGLVVVAGGFLFDEDYFDAGGIAPIEIHPTLSTYLANATIDYQSTNIDDGGGTGRDTGILAIAGPAPISGDGAGYVTPSISFERVVSYDGVGGKNSLATDITIESTRTLVKGSFALNNKSLEFGGLTTSDYINFNSTSNYWKLVTANTEKFRVDSVGSIYAGSQIVSVGGRFYSGGSIGTASNDYFYHNDTTNRWIFLSDGSESSSRVQAGKFVAKDTKSATTALFTHSDIPTTGFGVSGTDVASIVSGSIQTIWAAVGRPYMAYSRIPAKGGTDKALYINTSTGQITHA